MVSPLSVPAEPKYTYSRLAISFKELLEIVGKIYCQGKRTNEKQAVCLELGPLCSITEFPLPTQRPPSAGVIRGAFTGALQSYLTFSQKLLTFCGLTCAITYVLAKRCSEMQNLFEFARTTENLNTRGALKLCRFSSPAMSIWKYYACLRATPNPAAAH